MNILRLLNQSDYIQINNQLIKPEFMYASEDYADEDDVALEASQHIYLTETDAARNLSEALGIHN